MMYHTEIDMIEIEARARKLRAQAFRDLIVSLRRWVAEGYRSVFAARGHHA
ncbi:MAG: RSP_7527 family protein [Rubricella sp.]